MEMKEPFTATHPLAHSNPAEQIDGGGWMLVPSLGWDEEFWLPTG